MHVKILHENDLFEKVWPTNSASFPTITLQQLNSLTTIHFCRCLGILEIAHQRDVLGSIPGSSKDFYV